MLFYFYVLSISIKYYYLILFLFVAIITHFIGLDKIGSSFLYCDFHEFNDIT